MISWAHRIYSMPLLVSIQLLGYWNYKIDDYIDEIPILYDQILTEVKEAVRICDKIGDKSNWLAIE